MAKIMESIQRVATAAAVRMLAGAALVLFGTAAGAAKLDVDDGVVVKFGNDAGLVVRHALSTGKDVVFTGVRDTGTTGGAPGDWRGVRVEPSVATNALRIDGLTVRYAGASGAAAIEMAAGYALNAVHIGFSTVGVRVSGGTPTLAGLVLEHNTTGLQASNATPAITASEIAGNGAGIVNATPASVVAARGNWWGDATGPTDAQGNLAGRGDSVSAGVDYGQFLTAVPLNGCTVDVADGVYVRVSRDVDLALACRNAVEFRLAESADFGTLPYLPMSATAPYTLSAAAGAKMIHAQFRSAGGTTKTVTLPQAITYSPGVPVVAITAPDEGAVLVADTLFTASASDATGISSVEFRVGDRLVGTDTTSPYEATIAIADFTHGEYDLKATARNTSGQVATATRRVRIGMVIVDNDPPTLADVAFGGVALATSGTTTVTTPGSLTFATSDATTSVVAASAKFDGQALSGATFDGARYAAFVSFDTVANGAHTLVVDATDAAGNTASATFAIAVNLPTPSAPVIVSPVDGTVGQATVAVSGTAQPGSKVQLYLNGSASGPLLSVGQGGAFGASVQLPGEGGHTIHATASNSRGTSPASATVLVNYVVPPPTVLITSPADTAVLANDTDINASVIDPAGVASVAFAIRGAVVHTATQPPYTYRWVLANVADGEYPIAVTATSATGKTATASRVVFVEKTPPIPQPPQTPYTGEVQSATPASSYGEQEVVITGRALERTGNTPMPNSVLRLVLSIGGFQRKINVVTDAQGAFRFTFKPQTSDAGVYGVSANHPDEPIKPAQKTFTITRLNIAPTRYQLNAARTVSTPVRIAVSSSAGAGVSGFRFVMMPEDQESGTGLPNGISVSVSPPQDVPAGGSITVETRVLAAMGSGDQGYVVLTAYANDSGNDKRGKVRIDYNLRDPQPALSPSPMSVSTGVKRKFQVTEAINLKNSGALPASGVTATLVEASPGAGVPAWITLGSPSDIGDVGIGETKVIQVVATPPETLLDGVYRVNVRVTSANAPAGDVPVSVAVTDADTGSVAFQVEDIYTDPRPVPPVLGVPGASVRVQNERVLTLMNSATTDANGRARIDRLPIGNYVYRVSAPNHADATGRILVKPVGANGTEPTLETVFLDYELVSFEWSVTETTIQDRYDVTLNATYHTNVPAPVVVIEPTSINLPDLQQGEEFTGEITISNYGLVRADNFELTLPQDNDKLRFEFSGNVPSALGAKDRITLAYRITALQPFPADAVQFASRQVGVFKRFAQTLQAQAGLCSSLNRSMHAKFDYQCTNGTKRDGNANASFVKAWGPCGGSSGGAGGGSWGGAGGWGGPMGPMGTSLAPNVPGCTPECEACACKGTGSRPGSSGGPWGAVIGGDMGSVGSGHGGDVGGSGGSGLIGGYGAGVSGRGHDDR